MKKEQAYVVGIGTTNWHHEREVIAKGRRSARWLYVNLYAPPGTKYSDTHAIERSKLSRV